MPGVLAKWWNVCLGKLVGVGALVELALSGVSFYWTPLVCVQLGVVSSFWLSMDGVCAMCARFCSRLSLCSPRLLIQ